MGKASITLWTLWLIWTISLEDYEKLLKEETKIGVRTSYHLTPAQP